jgi:hypothetical protein
VRSANAGEPVRLRSIELRRTRFPLAILRGCATRSPQGRSVVPWPESKEVAKQMIKHNFLVSKNQEYHQVYQGSVSQSRFESASC